MAKEQSRARYPDQEGLVDRAGVQIHWEAYGAGEPTILFLPAWMVVHSRVWKMQIPYFARHARVVAFDPRGNGKSERPKDEAAHHEAEYVKDAIAVLDATGTERSVVVSFSKGAQCALRLAAEHPKRVAAAAFIGPMFPVSRRSVRWRLMGAGSCDLSSTGGRSRRRAGASSTPSTGAGGIPTSSSGG